MTDFDPNATPRIDAIVGAEYAGSGELSIEARKIERELKHKKEQLIIAKHNLLAISQLGISSDTYVQFANYALEKIEKVGQ